MHSSQYTWSIHDGMEIRLVYLLACYAARLDLWPAPSNTFGIEFFGEVATRGCVRRSIILRLVIHSNKGTDVIRHSDDVASEEGKCIWRRPL